VPYPVRGALDASRAHADESLDAQVANLLAFGSKRTIDLGWLIAFLVIYLLIVGPINYLVLRQKRKKELLWITMPALAIVFSLVGLGLSRGNQSRVVVKQANVVFATPTGSIGRRIALVATARQTNKRLELKSTYLAPVRTAELSGFNPGPPGTRRHNQPAVLATAEGSHLQIRTDPYSGSVLAANAGPTKGYLEAELAWDGRGFFGTVTNRTPYRMSEVLLIMGMESMQAGALDPGKSAPLSFVPPSPGERQSPGVIFSNAQQGGRYPMASFSGSQFSSGVTDLRSGLIAVLDRLLGVSRPLGSPTIVGLTSQVKPPITLDGADFRAGGVSLIASPVRFGAEPGVKRAFPSIVSSTNVIPNGRNAVNLQGPIMSSGPGSYPFAQGWPTVNPNSESIFCSTLASGLDRSRVASVTLRIGSDANTAANIGAPSPVPSPGAAPPPPAPTEFEVQVYSWGSGAWIPFRFQSGGSSNRLPVDTMGDDGSVVYRFSPQLAAPLTLWELGLEVEMT